MPRDIPTVSGCLRNHKAVADFAKKCAKHLSVIPAGERWNDGSLRPCVEDLLGAGPIIAHLVGNLSSESRMALSAFQGLADEMAAILKQCVSGRELIESGFEQDVDLASELNVSDCLPVFANGAYLKKVD